MLVEAMACGATVISTNCPGGPKEVLKDSECGMLVPMNDPEALAEAILRVLEDRSLRERLILAGLHRATDFSPANIARQYLEFMRSLEER